MLKPAAFLILFSLTINSGLSFGASRPQIPEAGPDLKLTQGISPEQFFSNRLKDSQCQNELSVARNEYSANKQALENLIEKHASSDAIDRVEKQLEESRLQLLTKVRQCGECATQDLERRVVTTTKKEYWYLTDGSCFIGNDKDQTTLNRNFDRAVARLKNIKKYPKKNGGFNAILDFSELDMDTGNFIPPVEKVENNPFYAFIGLKGPVALGIPVGFWYVFKNDIVEKETGDLREFILKFESVKKPANFPTPDLKIQSASGKLSSTMQRELTLVQGMWYVNNRGYVRYYTGADFGVSIPFAIDFALNTLLDTLLTLTEDSVSQD